MPDYLTIGGLVLAVVAIVGGSVLEGGHISSLVQLTALLIVLGGTLAATLVQTPPAVFLRALRRMRWAFMPPAHANDATVARIAEWSTVARRDGLLGLEAVADAEPDPFLRNALQLVVDGNDPAAIRRVLELDVMMREERELEAVRVLEAAGGYAPTVGILGAVLGLIHVLENLDDPETLGAGIAVAFVATVYGVAAANLVLLPLAGKMRSVVRRQLREMEMFVDGIVSVAELENPRTLTTRLKGYLD